jgi:hypothetical protein
MKTQVSFGGFTFEGGPLGPGGADMEKGLLGASAAEMEECVR